MSINKFSFYVFPWRSHVVCLYQKSVCKEYRTRLQSSATGFLMPNQRHISLPFIPIPYGLRNGNWKFYGLRYVNRKNFSQKFSLHL